MLVVDVLSFLRRVASTQAKGANVSLLKQHVDTHSLEDFALKDLHYPRSIRLKNGLEMEKKF